MRTAAALPTAACLFLILVAVGGCAESVSIRSNPPGAKAYLDGVLVGTTPTYAEVDRNALKTPHAWRVEFRNCDQAEGKTVTALAPGRVVGTVFTLGILAAFKSPYYIRPVDAVLTGGDCENMRAVKGRAPEGTTINIQQIVGDNNKGAESERTKTERLSERLTTLRDLYNRKLFSEATYETEREKAVREFAQ